MAPRSDQTPNDPLRAAFLASGLSAYELGQRVGIIRRYSKATPVCRDGEVIRRGFWGGDTTAVKRDLGLAPQTGRAKGTLRERIGIEKALRYADALGLDPSDLDL